MPERHLLSIITPIVIFAIEAFSFCGSIALDFGNMSEELFRILIVINSFIMLSLAVDTYRRLVKWDFRNVASAILMHLPPLTRKEWFKRAVNRSIPLLFDLSKKAMDEHFKKGGFWVPPSGDQPGYWIPASKPGPGHGVSMFIYALENHEFDPSQAVWEQLRKIGSEDIERMWEQLEDRDGLQNPFDPFKSL